MVFLNTQGWNWASTEIRHEEKAHELLCIMRRQHVDALLLADLHHPPVGLNWHIRNVNVAMEEFLLIVGDCTAIMISPRVQLAWQKAECLCQTAQGGRASMIEIELAKTRYHLIATYLLDVSKGAAVRKEAWKILGEWREVLSSQRQCPGRRLQQLWGGDWNSHNGQDAHERTPLHRWGSSEADNQPRQEDDRCSNGSRRMQWNNSWQIVFAPSDIGAPSRPAHQRFRIGHSGGISCVVATSELYQTI